MSRGGGRGTGREESWPAAPELTFFYSAVTGARATTTFPKILSALEGVVKEAYVKKKGAVLVGDQISLEGFSTNAVSQYHNFNNIVKKVYAGKANKEEAAFLEAVMDRLLPGERAEWLKKWEAAYGSS